MIDKESSNNNSITTCSYTESLQTVEYYTITCSSYILCKQYFYNMILNVCPGQPILATCYCADYLVTSLTSQKYSIEQISDKILQYCHNQLKWPDHNFTFHCCNTPSARDIQKHIYIQYQCKAMNLLYTLVPHSHHTASSQFSFRRLSYDCLSKIPHNLYLPVFRVIPFRKSIQKTLVLDSFTKHNDAYISQLSIIAFVQLTWQVDNG